MGGRKQTPAPSPRRAGMSGAEITLHAAPITERVGMKLRDAGTFYDTRGSDEG